MIMQTASVPGSLRRGYSGKVQQWLAESASQGGLFSIESLYHRWGMSL
jgi:hypothetical protein